jgi:hypothetical protein
MATTTNYAWETPDDTDLVKDGAAAIRTLGSSIDTTTKALNPSTTLGDIEYRSSTANTNTRLGIGSTGQILTVTGGVPTWATPATPTASTLAVAQIATGSITSGTQLQLTGLTSYDYLILKVSGNTWGTGNGFIQATLNNTTSTYDQVSSGYAAGNTYYNGNFGANQTTSAAINTLNGFPGRPQDRTTTANARFLYLQNCKATGFTTFQWIEKWRDAVNGDDVFTRSDGIFKTAAAISTIEYKQNEGYTFTAGTYTLWGA